MSESAASTASRMRRERSVLVNSAGSVAASAAKDASFACCAGTRTAPDPLAREIPIPGLALFFSLLKARALCWLEMYYPQPQREPSGCMEALIISRIVFGMLVIPFLMILGAGKGFQKSRLARLRKAAPGLGKLWMNFCGRSPYTGRCA